MSQNIPTWFVSSFNQNIQILLQQKVSRFRALVSSAPYVGKQASPVDQMGAVEMTDVGTRYEPMHRVDAPMDRRWLAPKDADLPQLIDSFDKLRLLTDPKSSYVANAVNAANRKIDDRIGPAFFGVASTGETGTVSTSFPASQVVGVSVGGTTSGLNVAKLERGRRILLANEADIENEPICVGITAADHESLMNEIQVISMDFNKEVAFDQNGMIKAWRGFQFVRAERPWLTTTATDDVAGQSRQLPMWVPSGMHLGIWDDIETDISQRKDLRGLPWQAYTKLSVNATRLDEKKVVKIWAR